jgi:thioredoxin-like negative regulator of GroEL
MPNLNLRLSDEIYWRFQKAKVKLKAKTNEEALLKLLEHVEKLLCENNEK